MVGEKMLNAGSRIVNSWLYPIQDGYVLIDTGYENGFVHFKRRLSGLNIELESIRYVFLTHAHDDHAGFLNQLLTELPDTKVVMSKKALEILYKGQNSFIGGCTSRIALFFCKIMEFLGKGEHRFPTLNQEFEKRCFCVSEDNLKEIEGELCGKIINTPGHTTDSISLLLDNGILFCGDAAMNGLPSIHKVTIWAEDKIEFARSWEVIIGTRPQKVYPGHGSPFVYHELEKNLPYARKMNLYPLGITK